MTTNPNLVCTIFFPSTPGHGGSVWEIEAKREDPWGFPLPNRLRVLNRRGFVVQPWKSFAGPWQEWLTVAHNLFTR